MVLKDKGISQCQCDCLKGTCSHCFITGWMKPWCGSCHETFNDSANPCCDKPHYYIRDGFLDNEDHIVKHTEAEKVIVRGWIKAHNDMLEESDRVYRRGWQTKTCSCGKDFSNRGGKLENCKACTMKIFDNDDEYREENLRGAHYNF